MPKHPPILFLTLLGCSEYDLTKQAASDPTPEVETEDTGWLEDTSPPLEPPPPIDTGLPPDCADFVPSPAPTVPRNEECLREPTVGTFTPTVEWQWSANAAHPGYHQIMSAPAVGNLDDDNEDGRVDSRDTPDVVFTSFSGGAYTSAGALTAIRGSDGATLWSIMDAGGEAIYSSSGVAIGDLEGDGQIEVCVSGTHHSVVCVNGADGSLKWAGGVETSAYGCPSIADLDGDGLAEVIHGRTILSASGELIAQGTGGYGDSYRASVAVDWDGDGDLEVVAGNTVYERDGTITWSDTLHDAAPAIGDFNLDGRPDLVRSGGGQVMVTMNDGTLLWSVPTAGGGSAGAPTVADFDGDGLPEVGVADLSRYTAYDTDGTMMWSNEVSDYSSSRTGSSVFDFEGDGSAEIVYADEHTLWVFDGSTGEVRMSQGGHASGTLMEYPLIADVDGDGSTEIVLASNNYAFSGWTGITVIGDADDSWAPARKIWNQYAYHITNVDENGRIPAVQTKNWLTWNNFRTGGTELGPANWQPDLSAAPPEICLDVCEAGEVTAFLPVINSGLIRAEDVIVVLERSDGTQIDVKSIPVVGDGVGWILGPLHIYRDQWGEEDLLAFVDWPDNVDECNETNNVINMGMWPCD